ncbi:Na(+) extrusion ABC transporter permease protein [Caldalkalibacillus thermarum TA2.A1]|uniref:Na(+) extrusion ABC transporter permease protein n=1 Tax=Caldalkalibacillus thermarum (strain TA2.A1) TaxID=986075 RepID=F5L6H2_CALTT|nr:ABC transporter permease subunit [Caldalkalibacillus thermarum]EGL83082.1 Na(+) extrusion ABC transporter permease protein [Caldalkalibacillus thermarum TA2.A1]
MFKQSWPIFKKEMTDLFRDRKTWMTSILLPVVLYPAIMFLIGFIMQSTVENAQSDIPITINDPSGIIEAHLSQHNVFRILPPKDDVEQAIRQGEIRFHVEVDPHFESQLANMESGSIIIYYDRSNSNSEIAYAVLREMLAQKSTQLLEERLAALGLSDAAIQPLEIKDVSVAPEGQEIGSFLSFIIPLFLLISCISGGLPASTDLVAGEKERGTLEALITTPVGGGPIMTGKLLTVTVMSFLSAILTFLSLILVFAVIPVLFPLYLPEGNIVSSIFTSEFFLVSVMLLLLVSAMIGALQLSISTVAKSFKEAQAYNTIVVFAVMLPVYLLMMTPAVELPFHYFWLPVINVVAIFKEVFAGLIHPLHLFISMISSLFYVVAAIVLFAYLFKKERFILK